LDLEENPIFEDKNSYYQTILSLCNSLEMLDSIEIQKIKDEFSQASVPSLKLDRESKSAKLPEPTKIESNDDDSKGEYDYTTDLTDSKNRSNFDKEDLDQNKNFNKSQSQFRRKGAEEVTRSKPQGKSVPKYKSTSPNKKSEFPSTSEIKHKLQGQNQNNPKSAMLGNQTRDFRENETSNLEPEKVIQIIQEQYYEEIQRVEVIFI